MTIGEAEWSQLTSGDRLCRSSQAVSVVDSTIYVFGGELAPREPVDNKMDIFNIGEPALQTVAAAEAPTPRVGSPGTTIGHTIYIFSGRGGIEMNPIEEHGALWAYRTEDNRWKRIQPADSQTPRPEGRSYHAITSDGQRKIYVHAGCPETGRLSDLWEFDVESRKWQELAPAPEPARGGTSIAYLDGKIYRSGGFDGKTEQGGALDVFDVTWGTWATISYVADGIKGPEPRSVAALLPVEARGRGYLVSLFGERDPSSLGHAGAGKMLSDVWAWDVGSANWEKIEVSQEKPVPAARGWFDADVSKTGEDMRAVIVVHGGLSEENARLDDIWTLNL